MIGCGNPLAIDSLAASEADVAGVALDPNAFVVTGLET